MNEQFFKDWSKAYNLTLSSSVASPEGLDLKQGKLLLLYIRLNPQSSTMTANIQQLLEMITKDELLDFFLRLTSRFTFISDKVRNEYDDLIEVVYKSANIHHELLSTEGSDEQAVNLLGNQNSEQHFTLEEFKMMTIRNRWYLVVIIFALIHNGK